MFLSSLILIAPAVLAAVEPTFLDDVRDQIGEPPIRGADDLFGSSDSTIVTAVNWMIDVFWILAVAFVMWAAFLYLTAGGNEEKITEAKKRLIYALIAAVIAILAVSIDYIVFNLLSGAEGI
jgi:peptidoglycan/LPS O-acetylase OafA/YrhL